MNNSNSVLSQLIRAQDAYNSVMEKWADIDTSDILLKADAAIKKAIEGGYLTCGIGGIEDLNKVEKAAIELAELGYVAVTMSTGNVLQADNMTLKQTFGIQINWKFMPANSRDKYTV